MAAITITKENFESEVLQSELPVLVDFWADWCMPCKMLAPTVDEIAAEYAGKIKVAKVNVDEQPEIALNYKIMSIPTLILFKDGAAADKAVGVQPKERIVEMLG